MQLKRALRRSNVVASETTTTKAWTATCRMSIEPAAVGAGLVEKRDNATSNVQQRNNYQITQQDATSRRLRAYRWARTAALGSASASAPPRR